MSTILKFKIFFVIVGILSFSTVPAFACSCSRTNSIPDLVEQTTYIFEGRVQKTEKVTDRKFSDQKTTFELIRSYKGNVPYPAEVFHPLANGGNCGLVFEPGQEIFMIAYEGTGGKISTNSCSFYTEYSSEQLIEYIERGIDTSELDEVCLWTIKKAYEGQQTSGTLDIEDKKCVNLVPLYDRLYPNKKY